MKATLPKPEHLSYKRHRKQVINQIILPVVLSVLAMIALIVLISLVTFRADGDVGRWAAISTIWIVIPVLAAGLIVLTILIGLIYLMARGLELLPIYTGIAQDYVAKARYYIVRGAHMLIKPILAIEGLAANIQEFFRKGQ